LFDLAESSDETELSRLLQLVLGCAVSCDRKQFYIEHIMSLEESVQHVLMNAIQEVDQKPSANIESKLFFVCFLVNGQRKSKNHGRIFGIRRSSK
jgi:hypothetical protein